MLSPKGASSHGVSNKPEGRPCAIATHGSKWEITLDELHVTASILAASIFWSLMGTVICYRVAKLQGRNETAWAVAGFIFPLVAVIVLFGISKAMPVSREPLPTPPPTDLSRLPADPSPGAPDDPSTCTYCGHAISTGWTLICDRCRMPSGSAAEA